MVTKIMELTKSFVIIFDLFVNSLPIPVCRFLDSILQLFDERIRLSSARQLLLVDEVRSADALTR